MGAGLGVGVRNESIREYGLSGAGADAAVLSCLKNSSGAGVAGWLV
jgi:hypothetical protein